jgi:hypothetical protein
MCSCLALIILIFALILIISVLGIENCLMLLGALLLLILVCLLAHWLEIPPEDLFDD